MDAEAPIGQCDCEPDLDIVSGTDTDPCAAAVVTLPPSGPVHKKR